MMPTYGVGSEPEREFMIDPAIRPHRATLMSHLLLVSGSSVCPG
jgi:hypothetical protein